jgi:hypothetical protein
VALGYREVKIRRTKSFSKLIIPQAKCWTNCLLSSLPECPASCLDLDALGKGHYLTFDIENFRFESYDSLGTVAKILPLVEHVYTAGEARIQRG